MKSKITMSANKTKARLKVKLDARTTIILHGMNMLKIWRQRYPDAQIIK